MRSVEEILAYLERKKGVYKKACFVTRNGRPTDFARSKAKLFIINSLIRFIKQEEALGDSKC